MRYIFILLFILIGLSPVVAQSDYEMLFKQGEEASNQGKYLMAVLRFKKAAELNPLNEAPYIQLAWNYLLLNNQKEALSWAGKAYYLNQTYAPSLSVYTYVLLAGNYKTGPKLLQRAVNLSTTDSKTDFESDFAALKAVYPEIFTQELLDQAYSNRQDEASHAAALFDDIGNYYEGKMDINSIITKLEDPVISTEFRLYFVKLFSGALVNSGYYDDAKTLIIAGRKYSSTNEVTEMYVKVSLIENLMRMSNYSGNYEQTIKYYKEIDVDNWFMLGSLDHPLAECHLLASNAYNALGQIEDQKSVAGLLIKTKNTYRDIWYQTQGYNSLGAAELNSSLSSSRAAAKSHLETALSMAENNGFQDLIPPIVSNLALSYWQHGMQDEAQKAYVKLSNDALARKHYLQAELYLNNLASLYFYNKDYRHAATYFQKSIDLIEQYRDQLQEGSKMTFLQARQSSYVFLISCLVKLKDGQKLFHAQESQRARVLADQLNNTPKSETLTLAGFQSSLSSDQAAIYYTLMETGAVIINVITHESSYAIRHEAFDMFIGFKNQYLARIQSAYKSREGYKPAIAERIEGGVQIQESDKARLLNKEDFEMLVQFSRELLQKELPDYDPIRNDFLRFFYSFLIEPVQNYITNKPKLLISPDGLLNFIPFEALINSQNQYLVQSHELSYMQSASVYNALQGRKYSNDRKGMVAFGGAIYEKMKTEAEPIRGAQRLNEIRLNLDQKLASGKSLREEYAAIGFGKMNYLPGTLAEVNAMSQIVPNSTVYRAQQFDESFIKQLAKSGELAKYKVVHFATHGFSLPILPELSGIATSIYPEEKNGEDGYLNVNEIAKLSLKADLAVLSACETGLGKIYGGEGVFGLTQSLLVAGANEAAVSLWPVSDAGTMYFMKGMYELVVNKGVNYSEAMTEMKRRFISGVFGKQFTHPNYWAPFIHYGKQ